MADEAVYVQATRAAIQKAINKIPSEAQTGATARAMMTRLGLTILGRIKKAFVAKSRGGTDEAGDRWRPLSPKTIAYSRRHPGLPRSKQRAAKRPSYALTTKQRERWWGLYARGLAMYKGNKGHAAARAWFILRGEGAVTLMDKYGNTQVDILRDTGLLLNSLSPGVQSGNQVFRVKGGEVVVGTNRKGAAAHHNGTARIPQRRLWPSVNSWPTAWWNDLLEQLKAGLVVITAQLVKGVR